MSGGCWFTLGKAGCGLEGSELGGCRLMLGKVVSGLEVAKLGIVLLDTGIEDKLILSETMVGLTFTLVENCTVG